VLQNIYISLPYTSRRPEQAGIDRKEEITSWSSYAQDQNKLCCLPDHFRQSLSRDAYVTYMYSAIYAMVSVRLWEAASLSKQLNAGASIPIPSGRSLPPMKNSGEEIFVLMMGFTEIYDSLRCYI